MAVNQKRVRNIFTDHTRFVNVYIIYIVYNLNTAALACVCWLQYPDIFLAFVLLQFLVVVVKISEFVGQDVGVGYEIEG